MVKMVDIDNAGRGAPLPQGQLETAIGPEQQEFRSSYLDNAPRLLELPTDFPRSAEQRRGSNRVAFSLPRELTVTLCDLSRRHGVTLPITLPAGWAVLMSRLSGQHDIIIGTPVAAPGKPDALPIAAVDHLPVRIRLEDNSRVADILAWTRDSMRIALAHRDVPFAHVIEAVDSARKPSYSPLFQVTFTMPGLLSHELQDGHDVPVRAPSPDAIACDLALSLTEVGDSIDGFMEYSTDLFLGSLVECIAEYYVTFLQDIVAHDWQRIELLTLLPDAERRRLLLDFNDTRTAAYQGGGLLHRLGRGAGRENTRSGCRGV